MSPSRFWRHLAVPLSSALALGLFFYLLPNPETEAEASEPETREARSFAIQNVRLFDGEKTTDGATVLVRGQTVAAVGTEMALPEGTEVIDGRGKTLLPGLIDSHTHNYGDALDRALQFGVTTQVDMFSAQIYAAQMRAQQAAGPVVHRSDLYSAGTLVTAPGGHGTQFGVPIPTLKSPEEADAFIAARVDEGSDFIKIVLEDGSTIGMEIPTLDRPTFAAAVRAAQSHDKLAVVHIHTLETALQAFGEGADGLVHLFLDRAPSEDFIRLASGRFVIPTLTVLESASGIASGATLVDDTHLASYLRSQEAQNLGRSFPSRESKNRYAHAEQTVTMLEKAGVAVLAGSDAPNPGTAHGASLHREMELLVQAGLTPVAALAAATSRPAEAFGLGDRGRIAPGLRADLLLVEGDPTKDILATRAIAGIWKAGSRVERHEAKGQGNVATEANTEGSEPHAAGPLSIATFDDGQMDAAIGFGWQSSTDQMRGGQSTVELTVITGGAEDSAGALAVQGEIHEGFPFPWAGAIYLPGTVPMESANFANHSSVVFQARGDGGPYRLLAFSDLGGQMPTWTTFEVGTEWQEVEVPFTALSLDGSGLRALLFTGGPAKGAFSFEIDAIELH